MVDVILRTLRYRCRRTSSFATRYLKEANTVNLAIETELAVLSELEKKKDKKKKQQSSLNRFTKKEKTQTSSSPGEKRAYLDDNTDYKVYEQTCRGECFER